MRHLVLAGLCLATLVSSAGAAELQVVEPDKLTLTGSDPTATLWLRNTGTQDVTPEFRFLGEDADHEEDERPASAEGDPVAGGSVGRFRVTINGAASDPVSGTLVATATGVAGAAVDTTIAPSPLLAGTSVETALLAPLLVAFVVVALWGWSALGDKRGNETIGLGSVLPGADWGKSSYATTLTAGGALLATIVSAGVLPDATVTLSKTSYTALALLFGVLVTVAGIFYGAFTRKDATGGDAGTVGTYLLAALITTWATYGQLYVLLLLVGELSADKGFSDLPRWILQGAVIATAIALVVYARRIRSTILEPPPKTKAKARAKAKMKTGVKMHGLAGVDNEALEALAADAADAAADEVEPVPRRISLL